MVLVSGTFTMLSRLIGAVAGKTLGWAVILLFGRVPQARQRLLSMMALASIAWVVTVVALLVPTANELVVTAVPRPGFVQRDWIGWLMVAGALLLPALVGVATVILSPDDEQASPRGGGTKIIRGYVFTPVLAGTIVFLAVWGVVRALRAMRHGWESVHIPMIVKPGGYEAVVDDVERALQAAGLDVSRHAASPWFVIPPRLLAMAGGYPMGALVPDELSALESRDLGVLVYPSDV